MDRRLPGPVSRVYIDLFKTWLEATGLQNLLEHAKMRQITLGGMGVREQ